MPSRTVAIPIALLMSLAPLAGCHAPADGSAIARMYHRDLSESSGLASSSARPGVWFTHNDSGGEAELFAFRLDGEFLGRHPVPGADAEDWEDMAAGPCPGSTDPCLYIGDIGDNARARDSVQVYATSVPGPGEDAVLRARWDLRYPKGAHNAETLLVDPADGRVYIVSKVRSGKSRVFRLPALPGPGELEQVAKLHFEGDSASDRLSTAGDFSADGERLVIRSYAAAWEWRVDGDDRLAHWQRAPRRIDLPRQRQGEAIAYGPDGTLITTSEGRPMPVFVTDPSGEDAGEQ